MGIKQLIFKVVFIIYLNYFSPVEAIKCYKCAFETYVYTPANNLNTLCKNFDYSENFIVDCPYSTFCFKKNTHARINGVQINGTDRDCASQKFDTQRIKNGKWHAEIEVEEPYNEGCKPIEDKGVRTAFIEHCYCRGDLCNNANGRYGNKKEIMIILIAVVFNYCLFV